MFIYRMGIIMKHNIIKFKNFKIDAYIQKVFNGFEFAPIEICKYKINCHKYFSIKIALIKLCIFIDFIWQYKK